MDDDERPLIARWPMPAVAVWLLCWVAFLGLRLLGAAPVLAMAVAATLGVLASLRGQTRWRQTLMALGFPLSWALVSTQVQGLVAVPAWVWLLPLGVFLLLYPPHTWRDAPLYPTPAHALVELPSAAPLPPGARVLDAGCGLGHGLDALAEAYPLARHHGIESSAPLSWLCARRCPWARVERGDIWQADWSGYDLVYLFQRPETMPRAVEKAQAELRPGAWLVSLAFEAPGLQPVARLAGAPGKPVWVYQPCGPATEPTPDHHP